MFVFGRRIAPRSFGTGIQHSSDGKTVVNVNSNYLLKARKETVEKALEIGVDKTKYTYSNEKANMTKQAVESFILIHRTVVKFKVH